jgi:hypothetical protein
VCPRHTSMGAAGSVVGGFLIEVAQHLAHLA